MTVEGQMPQLDRWKGVGDFLPLSPNNLGSKNTPYISGLKGNSSLSDSLGFCVCHLGGSNDADQRKSNACAVHFDLYSPDALESKKT